MGWGLRYERRQASINLVVCEKSMRHLIKQATEQARQAAQTCIQILCDLKNKIGIVDKEGNKVKLKVRPPCFGVKSREAILPQPHLQFQ